MNKELNSYDYLYDDGDIFNIINFYLETKEINNVDVKNHCTTSNMEDLRVAFQEI